MGQTVSKLPVYNDKQLRAINDLDADKVSYDFGKYDSSLRGAEPDILTLPNGQDILWSAYAPVDGGIQTFAVGFKDTQGQLVTAAYKAHGNEVVVGAFRSNGYSWGPLANSFNASADDRINDLNMPRIFDESRVMIEAAAEMLEIDSFTPDDLRDDLQHLDRAMEIELGVTPRDLAR